MAVMLRQPVVVRRRGAPAPPGHAAGWVFATLAAALMAWQAGLAFEEAVHLRAQRDGLAALQRTATARTSAMVAEERGRHAQIEAVAKILAAPASLLLDAVEAPTTTGVTLRRIAYDRSSGVLELDARANSLRARQDYLRALAQGPHPHGVRLHGLQDTAASDTASKGGLAFRVTAHWPAASEPTGRAP
jgi:hypothetical protein